MKANSSNEVTIYGDGIGFFAIRSSDDRRTNYSDTRSTAIEKAEDLLETKEEYISIDPTVLLYERERLARKEIKEILDNLSFEEQNEKLNESRAQLNIVREKARRSGIDVSHLKSNRQGPGYFHVEQQSVVFWGGKAHNGYDAIKKSIDHLADEEDIE